MNMQAQSAWRAAPGRRSTIAQLLLLALVVAAATYARVALGPLQELAKADLALTDSQIGVLQGPALTLPMVIAAIPLGLLIDRQSRTRLLSLCLLVALIGSVATALAPTYAILIVARAVTGLATFSANPIAVALIADLFEPGQRGRASTATAMGQTAGMSAVWVLGGVLIVVAPGDSAAFGPNGAWRLALLGLCVPLALVFLCSLMLREPARDWASAVASSKSASLVRLWHYRDRVGLLLLGVAAFEVIFLATISWAGPALGRAFLLQPDQLGSIMGVILLISGIGGPLLGGLAADASYRVGGPRAMLAVLAILGLAVLPASLFAAAHSLWVAGLALLWLVTLVSAICMLGTTMMTVVVPPDLRGLFFGAFVGLVLLIAGVAPMLVSQLSDAMGGATHIGPALGAICLGAGVAGILCFVSGRVRFPIDLASDKEGGDSSVFSARDAG
jgi:MFS family permease